MRSVYFSAFMCGVCAVQPAWAVFNVSGTGIKKGVLEVESRNRWDDDDRANRGLQVHAIKSSYGITDRWAVEMQNNWQDTAQEGFAYDSTEIESKFRFFEPEDGYWLDFALKLSYDISHETVGADEVKAKFLLAKDINKILSGANINFSKEIGSNARRDTALSASWQSKYDLSKELQPGFEIFSSFGELVDMPDYNGQSHRAGPMLYGTLGPGIKYQMGYLFGISRNAEDGSFKLFLKYEFPL